MPEKTDETGPDPIEDRSESDEERAPTTPIWKKLAIAVAGLFAIIFTYVAIANLQPDSPSLALNGPVTVAQVEPETPPVDSLGFRFTEVRDLWNSLDRPPSIPSALRRVPESGEMDSFFHRFDSSAELLGAYRDKDDFVVALLARAHVASEDAKYLYLHLCHMLHPFSPECIDSYFAKGLGGLTLEEAATTDAAGSWEFEANTWDVGFDDNVLTIRVRAPASN